MVAHYIRNLLDGERSVGELAGLVGLSSAALSQHLGKMRARAGEVLQTLYRLHCAGVCCRNSARDLATAASTAPACPLRDRSVAVSPPVWSSAL
ncbi:helix-turn-helix domain-containing protein [Bradyrhizobium sp. UFLA05-109]